jgi:ABC-type dipeptide/oligopeptide/nickel transport system permease component
LTGAGDAAVDVTGADFCHRRHSLGFPMRKPYSTADNAISILSLLGYCLPAFWLGQMLMVTFFSSFGCLLGAQTLAPTSQDGRPRDAWRTCFSRAALACATWLSTRA